MVLVPMKAPCASLLATLPMKHMAMNEPLACIRVDKTYWNSDHLVASATTRLNSHAINKMTDRTLICKGGASAEGYRARWSLPYDAGRCLEGPGPCNKPRTAAMSSTERICNGERQSPP